MKTRQLEIQSKLHSAENEEESKLSYARVSSFDEETRKYYTLVKLRRRASRKWFDRRPFGEKSNDETRANDRLRATKETIIEERGRTRAQWITLMQHSVESFANKIITDNIGVNNGERP